MELRIIDTKPFLVTRAGKKETATPTGEVVAQARQRISDARDMLRILERSRIESQTGLEAALLRGQPTEPYRLELANISELSSDQRHEISDATGDIATIEQMLDQHAAVRLRLADADAIDALIRPFETFLEQHQ
ncbi:MAG: hypothetical protein PHQ58_21945 [Rhodoferax sp.]|uniref:hypothetical protein n=1 Tax=Rhodoferax sp. TaxID=50421 RepID=UPI00260F31E3|nr:hypothetical protein [Rhodoferax sp.]MDD2883084.1 hypothetical protein [Rhodoferax sp.]